jgi:hypothetical protein
VKTESGFLCGDLTAKEMILVTSHYQQEN